MFKSLLILGLASLFISSCALRRTYYLSPLNSLQTSYQLAPMQSDSMNSATYGQFSFTTGSANFQGTDKVNVIQLGLTRAHNIPNFQFRYGADFLAGNYRIAPLPNAGLSRTVKPEIVNAYAGNHSFGAGGISAMANVVTGGKEIEWRVFGVETSIRREFGNYLAVRKALPDSAVSVIVRSPWFSTIGVFTEAVARPPGTELGLRLGAGKVLGAAYQRTVVSNNGDSTNPGLLYFNMGCNLTVSRITGVLSITLATKATSAMFGVQYRLNK